MVAVLILGAQLSAREVSCPSCGGSGISVCLSCEGIGTIAVRRNGKTSRISCATCGGRRYISCGACGGSGKVHFPERDFPKPAPKSERKTCVSCNGCGTLECTQCRNSGYGAGKQGCASCIGRGWTTVNILTGERAVCATCGGSGTKACYKCDGTGRTDCRPCNGIGYFD